MRKVLFLKSAPAFPIHGADISVFERLALLRPKGWSGIVVSTGRLEHANSFQSILSKLEIKFQYDQARQCIEFKYQRIPCVVFLDYKADQFVTEDPKQIHSLFLRAIHEYQPDALMGNVRDMTCLDFLAKNEPLAKVMFLTEDEYPREGQPGALEFAKNISKIDHVLVATHYLQKSIFHTYGIEAKCLTNTVLTAQYRQVKPTAGQFITMMHPYRHKGVEFFLQLVEALPEKEFMLLAGTGLEYRQLKPRLQTYPNLKLHPFTKKTDAIYRQSHLVLVPSLWQEAFSRVIIEALCALTPVISSGSGGMQETGGNAVTYIPLRVEEYQYNQGRQEQQIVEHWRDAITAFDSASHYTKAQELGLLRVSDYEQEVSESIDTLDRLLRTPTVLLQRVRLDLNAIAQEIPHVQTAIAEQRIPLESINTMLQHWSNEYRVDLEYCSTLVQQLLLLRPRQVLECGSGFTTILLGILADKLDFQITTLEHDEFWVSVCRRALEFLKLSKVSLIEAALTSRADFDWYAIDDLNKNLKFDFIVCDGPPGTTNGGRRGLLPVLAERLERPCLILLDDANRPAEQETLDYWKEQYAVSFELLGDLKKHALVKF